MKKIFILSFLYCFFIHSIIAQNVNYIHVNLNDMNVKEIMQQDIDSIVYLPSPIVGNDYNETYQCIYTNERVYSFDVKDIEDVTFNMGKIDSPQHFYSVIPLDNSTEWDSLLISTRGYYAAVKENQDGIRTFFISLIGEKNLEKTITATFSPENSLSVRRTLTRRPVTD